MKLTVLNTSGKNTEMQVNDDVFGIKPNARLLAQAVYVYLSNQRQGTHKVKTRSEVNRTKKKWYKQKGTGNARHGSRNPNIFVGGGVTHGPAGITNWSKKLTKAQKRKAFIYALSSKVKNISVSEHLEKLSSKTKSAQTFFTTVYPKTQQERILLILDAPHTNILRATNNLSNVLATQAKRVTVYELLLADHILCTKEAVSILEKRALQQEKVEIEKPVKTSEKSEKLEKPPTMKKQTTETTLPKVTMNNTSKAVKNNTA